MGAIEASTRDLPTSVKMAHQQVPFLGEVVLEAGVWNNYELGRISDDRLSSRSLISELGGLHQTTFVLRFPHSIGYIIFALRATAIESSLPTVCFFSALFFPTSDAFDYCPSGFQNGKPPSSHVFRMIAVRTENPFRA